MACAPSSQSIAKHFPPFSKALAGSALYLWGGSVPLALAENWQLNRTVCCSAKAREIGVLLAAQLVTGAGLEIGVSRVGLSAESWLLAYLLL